MRKTLTLAAAIACLSQAPATADAFCGFYVSGAGGDMFNNATQVVMMRAGTRTVLSMQNNYQGPPEKFAMVVPVPVVLKEDNVKILPKEIFARVDKLAAPRLVEYWEQDPCYKPEPRKYRDMATMAPESAPDEGGSAPEDFGVKIEAQFTVGEYDIAILSATESTGLDKYLRVSGYTIPAGAAPYLKPYIEGGMKFFVAKVDPQKVAFKDGMAMLSPLRFHYDSQDFNLPIRLGMVNSGGTQDLIVHVLSPGQRYEVANYKNVTIPTNIDVENEVRHRFGEFYAALFDATLAKNPGAVITEYSWNASSCDPCPEPALQPNELATLGADVLGLDANQGRGWYNFVLTRMHARYAKDGISDDLVFRAAGPIVGGREHRNANGQLEERSKPGSINNFQGRYAIRHEWTGPIECLNPIRGRWGGPPSGTKNVMAGPQAATDLAFAPRGKASLPKLVAQDIPEIGVVAGDESSAPPAGAGTGTGTTPGTVGGKKSACGGCAGGGAAGGLLVGLTLLGLRRRRRA